MGRLGSVFEGACTNSSAELEVGVSQSGLGGLLLSSSKQ